MDAVDTVTAKLALVMKAQELHIPIISSMGAGNKLDPTAFRVADIYQTKVCPLAKVMRIWTMPETALNVTVIRMMRSEGTTSTGAKLKICMM